MKAANDGGPAFPLAAHDDVAAGGSYVTQQGMSLRDWFAGKALAGLVSEHGRYDPTGAALDAYSIADAMLRARERGQEVEEDEAWFRAQAKSCLHRDADGMASASCEAGERIFAAGGFSRAAAIRALRAKVEGGAR